MIDIVNVLAYGRVAMPYGISYLYSVYIGVKWNFSLFVDVRHFLFFGLTETSPVDYLLPVF